MSPSYSIGHLALGVGPQPGNRAVLPQVGDSIDDPVRQCDRQRHQLGGIVASEAEHHPLVAGSDVLAPIGVFIDAHGDVGRLLAQGDHHGAGRGVETHFAGRVADLAHDLADDRRVIHHGLGRDLTGQADQARSQQALAGDPGIGILCQDGIQNAVGDLVGHLVGMAHRDGFTREQVAIVVRHGKEVSSRAIFDVPGP